MLREGMNAIITGGAKGIGKGIAMALNRHRIITHILDNDDDAAQETAERLRTNYPSFSYHCDLSDPWQIEAIFDHILKDNEIDILVNNAGIFIANSYLKGSYEEALEIFDRQMNINARATYLCTKKIARHMAERKSGHILNIVTNHLKREYFRPSRSEQAYDASKWAQYELNESMDRELKEHGIRVNALCPASTRTAMLEGFFKDYGIELNAENVGKVTHFASLLEIEDVGTAAYNVLNWDDDQPTGNAYLLIYKEDCEELEKGHSERLKI
ncbi:MAG: SDR family oxidoreductase [Erysipelotrichaceae bacterium]|nr:SDR family oxidoreductase [Erysipelotrichaceae bacterium]